MVQLHGCHHLQAWKLYNPAALSSAAIIPKAYQASLTLSLFTYPYPDGLHVLPLPMVASFAYDYMHNLLLPFWRE